MADVATRLRNFLLSKTAITNYVGKRIVETRPPQHIADPYIRFASISSENADVLNGSVGDDPLSWSVQIEAVGRDETVVKALNANIRTALHLYRSTFDDTTAKGCFVDTQDVDLERFSDGSDSGYFIGISTTRIFL